MQMGKYFYIELTPNVVLSIVIMGAVMRPQEKNWRRTATTACQVEGRLKLHRVMLTSLGNS